MAPIAAAGRSQDAAYSPILAVRTSRTYGTAVDSLSDAPGHPSFSFQRIVVIV
jgi:hypothetical protein